MFPLHKKDTQNPLQDALRESRITFWSVGLFSCAINILMLTGPLFMLQIYDRVLVSYSVPTLVALFGLVVILYSFLGLFDFIRMKALSRVGYRLDINLMVLAEKVRVFLGLSSGNTKLQPVQDLTSIRQFLSSYGLPALFDLPWVPIYLVLVYLLHVWLGLLSTLGAVIVVTATVINEIVTKKQIAEASSYDRESAQFSDGSQRNAEAIIAMGMTGRILEYWKGVRYKSLSYAQRAGGQSGFITAFIKAIRMLLQSGILALGAYLAIYQEVTPGTMIAASILAGRALAPIDLAVGNWKNFIHARLAYGRLSKLLSQYRDTPSPIQLPKPKGHISVSHMYKMAKTNSGEQTPILQNIHFSLEPGDGLGVIGPSASGKSSLARLLVGLNMPDKGSVRLDGARYDQWDRDAIGRYLGYLPQSVGLMAGSIRQNIARFDEGASDKDIIAASQLAGVHDLILGLPDGYATNLTHNVLSGGQVQRIALARALFRFPPLVVLDEPNAHLDMEGDVALTCAIEELREKGSCIIVMAHRPSALAAVNKVLMLREGLQIDFGLKDEVLHKVLKPAAHMTET